MMDWGNLLGTFATVAIELIYVVAVVGTIIVVILDNRNPLKTLAWVLVLTFLPIVGLVFYVFFGRDERRNRIISKRSYSRLLKRPMDEFLSQQSTAQPLVYNRLLNFFQQTNQALPFDGNEVEFYTDGISKLQALIRSLYKAKHHIHFEYYIFMNDAVGTLIRDVLIDKAREGVEVRVIYDDVGSWHTPNDFFEKMKEEGIEVKSFLKVRFPLFTSKVNYRNHRKIVVIDGKEAFLGGMNIATRYVRGFDWGIWRDTHMRIRGKAVHGVQTIFLLDWFIVDQMLLYSKEYFPKLEDKGNTLMQIVTSEPIGQWREIMQGMVMAISSAKSYFYMQTPYFLPTEPMMTALQTAALAGVDVRLMLPEHADSPITHLGTHSFLADVLKAGVKVYFYQKGFLHAKMIVSDDMLSSVGSTNLDFRSFEHNFEVNAFMYNTETANQLKNVFLADQRDCYQVFLKNWIKRPWYLKVIESVVRLLSPLL